MNYITSDLHFSHKNMCGPNSFLETRKHFNNIDEMNNYLIEAHNSVVAKYDTTYHLGDLTLHETPERVFNILNQMKGQFVLIKGNHDDRKLLNYLNTHNYELKKGFPKFIIHDVGCIIKYNKKQYMLTHYPMLVGDGRNSLRNLCGHIHELPAPSNSSLNVGVDSPELPVGHVFGQPIAFHTATELLENKVDLALKNVL